MAGADAAPPTAAILLLALLIDGYVGDAARLRQWPVHPLLQLDRAIAWFDGKLNRPHRDASRLRFRGALVAAVVLAAAALIGVAVRWLAEASLIGAVVELTIVASLVAQRGAYERTEGVAAALEGGGAVAGRAAVTAVSDRDPNHLDHYGVARTAIESLADSFARRVVTPALYYVLFGPPGLLAAAAADALRRGIGGRDPRYDAFGRAARGIDRIVAWAPARAAALLLALVAIVLPEARPGAALRTAVKSSGQPAVAAMAGALDLALGGPRRYGASVVDAPWLGVGRARADAGDIRRALRLYLIACITIAAAAALATLVWLI